MYRRWIRTKHRRVELRLEIAERLLLEIAPPAALDGDVVVLRLEVVDLLDGNDVHLGALANQDALQRRAVRPRGGQQVRDGRPLLRPNAGHARGRALRRGARR